MTTKDSRLGTDRSMLASMQTCDGRQGVGHHEGRNEDLLNEHAGEGRWSGTERTVLSPRPSDQGMGRRGVQKKMGVRKQLAVPANSAKNSLRFRTTAKKEGLRWAAMNPSSPHTCGGGVSREKKKLKRTGDGIPEGKGRRRGGQSTTEGR